MTRHRRLDASGMLPHLVKRGMEGPNAGSNEIRETLCPAGLTSAVVLSHSGGRERLSGCGGDAVSRGNDLGDNSWGLFGGTA